MMNSGFEETVEVELDDFSGETQQKEQKIQEELTETIQETIEFDKPEEEDGDLFPLAPITLIEREENDEDYVIPPWNWVYLVADIVGIVVVLLVFIIILVVITDGEDGEGFDGIFWMTFLFVIQWAVMAGPPIALSKIQGNGPIVDFGITFRSKDIGWGIAVGVGGFIIAMVCAFLTKLVVGDFDAAVSETKTSSFAAQLFLFFLIAIPGPIVEEILFRGFFFFILARHRLHAAIVVAICGALFAIGHLEPPRIFILFVMGCIFTYARVYFQSITPCIVAHIVNNTLAVLLGVVMWAIHDDSPDSDQTRVETAREMRYLVTGY